LINIYFLKNGMYVCTIVIHYVKLSNMETPNIPKASESRKIHCSMPPLCRLWARAPGENSEDHQLNIFFDDFQ
jgi:hypothetical protein